MGPYTAKHIQEKTIDIVATALRIKRDEVLPDSHLQRDLSADSLDTLNIAERLEEEFDIEIPNEVAQEFMTVSAIVSGIAKLTDEAPNGDAQPADPPA